MNYKYMTIEDTFLENGYLHFEKALLYKELNYPDRFYEGSMRKARKWFKKAKTLEVPEFIKPFLDAFTYGIAFGIMNADGSYTPLDNGEIYEQNDPTRS